MMDVYRLANQVNCTEYKKCLGGIFELLLFIMYFLVSYEMVGATVHSVPGSDHKRP